MRNRWRVLAFDILAPTAAVAALMFIGIALAWSLWWVSVCSMLSLSVPSFKRGMFSPPLRSIVSGLSAGHQSCGWPR